MGDLYDDNTAASLNGDSILYPHTSENLPHAMMAKGAKPVFGQKNPAGLSSSTHRAIRRSGSGAVGGAAPEQGVKEIEYAGLRFQEEIGSGAYASVFKGEWLRLPVAIKKMHKGLRDPDDEILTQDLDSDDEAELDKAREDFLAEVSLLSNLRHPNLILYMGASAEPGKPLCMISELYKGGSLSEFLEKKAESKISTDQALDIAIGISRGMLYLHTHKPQIMHRDLKNQNVLVRDESNLQNVVIVDFGLSCFTKPVKKVEPEDSDSSMDGCAMMTTPQGTITTMAPEIMEGAEYSSAADVYSFGIMMWEIFTCRQVYEGLNPVTIMFKVMAEDERPDFRQTDNVPPAIRNLIEKCWHKEPHRRPNFCEIIDALDELKA